MAILAHQETFKTGPTGVVHRGPEPRTEDELRDNREFLRVAGQVDFGPRAHVLTLVWMAVAYYASLKPERTCYARVDTLAKKSKGLSTRTVQRKLNELAVLGYIVTDHRSGGFRSTSWDVELYPGHAVAEPPTACHPAPDSASPPPRHAVIENHDSVSPDIRDRREGTSEKKKEEYVRTEAPSPTATVPMAVNPFDSHTTRSVPSQLPDDERPPQTRLYAALYRKMEQPDWPELTDQNLDTFTRMSTAQRKSILSGLLATERAAGKHPDDKPSSKPLEGIAAKGRATLSERHGRQREAQQDACTHDWLAEGYCGQCGAEKPRGPDTAPDANAVLRPEGQQAAGAGAG